MNSTYDRAESYRAIRQVRELQKDIPKLATKILTGDFTRMWLFGQRCISVVDEDLWKPVFDERQVLVDRLEILICGKTDAATVQMSEDATAESYPQLARDWNARAFYDLAAKTRLKTKYNHNPATIRRHKRAYIIATGLASPMVVPPISKDQTAPAAGGCPDSRNKPAVGIQEGSATTMASLIHNSPASNKVISGMPKALAKSGLAEPLRFPDVEIELEKFGERQHMLASSNVETEAKRARDDDGVDHDAKRQRHPSLQPVDVRTMSDCGLAPPPYSAAVAQQTEEPVFPSEVSSPGGTLGKSAESVAIMKKPVLAAQSAGPCSRSSNPASTLKLPLTAPGVLFQLWIRSPVIKGIKIVSMTDSMTGEEVFAALQWSLGRPFEGKEILSFFVSIPDEEEPFRIDKGDSDDGGWEAVLCMVKEANLKRLDGVVEADADDRR